MANSTNRVLTVIAITFLLLYISSFFSVLALERHSIEIEKAASSIVYASYVLKQWAQSMNISINLSEYNGDVAKKLLSMVYNNSRLALFIGAIQLRALKMLSGEESYITGEDVAKVLIAILKGSGLSTNNLSCDEVISKLAINLYYGYEMCKYNITDIYNFINFIAENAREMPANVISKLVSKFLITLMLYNGIITMNGTAYESLLNEMLLYDSIVSAIFLKSYVELHPISFKSQPSYKIIYSRSTPENSSVYLDFNIIEKAVYRLMEIAKNKNNVKIGDVIAAIIIGMSYKPEEILQIIAQSSLSSEDSIAIIEHYDGENSSTKLGSINNTIEIVQSPTQPYNTAPYLIIVTPTYMGIGYTVAPTQFDNEYHRGESPSTNRQGIKVDFDMVKGSRIITEIVSKSNTVVLVEPVPEYSQIQDKFNSTKPIILLSNQNQQYFYFGNSMITVAIALSILSLVAITIFRHNLFKHIKAFLGWGKAKIVSNWINRYSRDDERCITLYRFWTTLSLVCRKIGISISSFDTHRDVLAKFMDKGYRDIHLIRLATAKYEIIRYSNAWSRRDLDDLNKVLDALENAGDL
ncbi:MAG: hypothetical protein QW632_02245 [Ignisphaera sp.]